MLYLLDEDRFDAIRKTYRCDYIFNDEYEHKLRYFKAEEDVDFQPEMLTSIDVICIHNSFPSEKTAIVERVKFLHEETKLFHLVLFSLDSGFYNLQSDESEVKIHKDKFYCNLKSFIDSGCHLSNLLYGEFAGKSEARLITTRISEMIFSLGDEESFDLTLVLPRDLKRLCELAQYNYDSLLNRLHDTSVGTFRKLLAYLNKNI
jgi:hypothetical protein